MKKGFTLIELLAVILILGIIALIAIPQVTNVISNASRGATETSAKHYVSAVNNTIALNKLDTDSSNNINDGLIDISTIEVNMSGEKPTSGSVYVKGGNVLEAELEVNGKNVFCGSNGKCTAYDKYIYYNESTAITKIINGKAVTFTSIISSPAKDKWLYEVPASGIYARYKLLDNKIVGNADICSVEIGFCISVDLYNLSVERTLNHFNYNESTWTYLGTFLDTTNPAKSITYKKWTNSTGLYCEFGDVGTDNELVYCHDGGENSSDATISLTPGKKNVSIYYNGANCNYDVDLGVSCTN